MTTAFVDDPVYRHLLPDARQRTRALTTLFGSAAGDAARFGAVDVATDDLDVLGAALWLAPGRFPMSPGRKLRTIPAMLALLLAVPQSLPRLVRLGVAVDAAHPHEPTWYLQAIGVQPGSQRRGLCAGLLAHGLAGADHDRVPVTLETTVPAAAALYERAGFHTVRVDHHLADGPSHRQMRRPPISDTSAGASLTGSSPRNEVGDNQTLS